MSQQIIAIGAAPNDGTGDQLRTAFDKTNDNFSEIYAELGGTSLSNISISGNTISTDDTNGNLTLDPNGTGSIVLTGNVPVTGNLTVTGKTTVSGAFAASGTAGASVAFAATDTTPSVSAGNLFTTDGTAQTISTFDDGTVGQIINVVSTDATVYDVSGTLKGGTTNITTASGDVTTWVFDGTNWYLINFMDVSANLSTGH